MPIDRRDPVLELLRRGDLLAVSPLRHDALLALLREALHDRLRHYARRDADEPGNALLAAFAAALDTFGFHHDRFLTESKLASARTLRAVTRLAAAVGYRPRPPIAAVGMQHFVARARGLIPAGTAVSGRSEGDPSPVHFETRHALEIAPSFNDMRLAPVIAAHAGARHGVLAARGHLTPLDDFFAGALALVSGELGAELLPVAGARRRAVAFGHGLRRSYEPGGPEAALDLAAAVTAATQLRRLDHWTLYDHPDDDAAYAVAELSRDPILHLRDDRGAGTFTSSLELHIFEPGADPRDPSRWRSDDRWREVPDFADSEADDRHYRTIVDDRMRTYVVVRVRVGHRYLLGARPVKSGKTVELRCERLRHAYARFTPALGRIPRKGADESDIITLEFDRAYFETPLVARQATNKQSHTDWAMLDRSGELAPGTQIIVDDSTNQRLHIRTLSSVDGPHVSWRAPEVLDPPPPLRTPTPLWKLVESDLALPGLDLDLQPDPNADPESKPSATSFQTILGPYFPTTEAYKVAPGRGVLHGDAGSWPLRYALPSASASISGDMQRSKVQISELGASIAPNSLAFWSDYYQYVNNPDWSFRRSRYDLGGDLRDKLKAIDQRRVFETVLIARGELFLLLESTANLKPGDFFLLGKRIRLKYRNDPIVKEIAEGADENYVVEQPFSPDWLVAEVLQAIEVHGKVVRLRYPVQNEYTLDFSFKGASADETQPVGRPLDVVTELLVIPNVASVYYGDRFTQRFPLSPSSTYVYRPNPLLAKYTVITIDPPIATPAKLRQTMQWTGLADVFVGVANQAFELDSQWSLDILFRRTGLAPGAIAALRPLEAVQANPTQIPAPGAAQQTPDNNFLRLRFVDTVGFDYVLSNTLGDGTHAIDVVLAPDLAPFWSEPVDVDPVQAGQFRITAQGGKMLVLNTPLLPLTTEIYEFAQGKLKGPYPCTHVDQQTYVEEDIGPSADIFATPGFLPLAGTEFEIDEKLKWAKQNLDDYDLYAVMGGRLVHDPAPQPSQNQFVSFKSRGTVVKDGLEVPQIAVLTARATVQLAPANVHTAIAFEIDDKVTKAVTDSGSVHCSIRTSDAQELKHFREARLHKKNNKSSLVLIYPQKVNDPPIELERLFVIETDAYAFVKGAGDKQIKLVAPPAAPLPAEFSHVALYAAEGDAPAQILKFDPLAQDTLGLPAEPDPSWKFVRFSAVWDSKANIAERAVITFEKVQGQAPNAYEGLFLFKSGKTPKLDTSVQIDDFLDEGETELLVEPSLVTDFAGGTAILAADSLNVPGQIEARAATRVRLASNPALEQVVGNLPWNRLVVRTPTNAFFSLIIDPQGGAPDGWLPFKNPVSPTEFAGAHEIAAAQRRADVDVKEVTTLAISLANTGLGDVAVPPLLVDDELALATPNGLKLASIKTIAAGPQFFSITLAAGPVGITSIRLNALRAPMDPTDFGAGLRLTWPPERKPEVSQPYVLLSAAPTQESDLRHALIRASDVLVPSDLVRHYVFADTASLAYLEGRFGPPGVKAYALPNDRDELLTLAYDPPNPSKAFEENFLTTEVKVDNLFVNHDSPPFIAPAPVRFILGPAAGFTAKDEFIGELYEGGVENAEEKTLNDNVLTESIVFNSGNFIPVRLGNNTHIDKQIVSNSLRIFVFFANNGVPEAYTVTYDPQLSLYVEALENGTVKLEGLADHFGIKPSEPPHDFYLYSFNKTNEGTFTLNFLIITQNDLASLEIEIHVVYSSPLSSVCDAYVKDPENAPEPGDGDALYLFETHVHAWNPLKQLIVLDPQRLKAGDYLFLSRGRVEEGLGQTETITPDAIQWTKVLEVNGRFVAVYPPLLHEPRQVHRYILGTYRPAARRFGLDADYYKLIHEQGADGVLPFGKHLVLDRHAAGFADLIPGDRLLLWDERARESWQVRREFAAEPVPDWRTWPEGQHEAVIKHIHKATGLITLVDPLPARFAVRFAGADSVTADVERFRVFPHYREPFQGRRRLQALGDGDRALRFQRFSAGVTAPAAPGVPSQLGHFSVHAEREGAFVSNLEVITYDPRPGEWARWTEFSDLARAQRKDPACTIGVERSRLDEVAKVQTLDLQIAFGDGVTGQRLPSGQGNVFLRAIDTGGLADLLAFAVVRDVHVLDRAKACLPLSVDDVRTRQKNLRITVTHGGHLHWRPAGDGSDAWALGLALDLRRADGTWRTLPALSDEDAIAGREGFIVRPTEPPRPGACDLYVCANHDLHDDYGLADIRVRDLPRAEPWRLDRGFYDDLLAVDMTQVPGASHVPLDETEGLRDGAWLAWYRDSQRPGAEPELTRAVAVDHDTYSARLAPPLRRTYDLARSYLVGNLVEVDQGKRDTYAIGSGDSSVRGLRLGLFNRAPLIHRLGGGPDPEPWLDILVDDVPWTRVADFDDVGAHDRVYRLDLEPDGHAAVVFGDGVRGRVPPTGRDNIQARLHLGDGARGNLGPGAIDTVRDGHLAIRSTRNITAAAGGLPAADAGDARGALLARGPFNGRAVTAADLARIAPGLGDILHAELDPFTDHRICRLVVALRERRGTDEAGREELRRRLLAQLPAAAGVELELVLARNVAVHLVVHIDVADGRREGDVLAAVELAFAADGDGFFAAERWPIGAMLRLSDVYERLFAVPGVEDATVVWMRDRLPPTPIAPAPAEAVDPGPDGQIACTPGRALDPRSERGSFVVHVRGDVP